MLDNIEEENFIENCVESLNHHFIINYSQRDLIIKNFMNSPLRDLYQSIILDAENLLNHNFSFLGSEIKKLGSKIKWNTDIGSGYKWPMYHSKEVPIIIKKNVDIIRIWELSRFQWAFTLGKAFWLSGDERYAKEIINQCLHWIKYNPLGYGPNWKSSQDVAIRAINWIDSLCFINNPRIININQKKILFASLYEHGLFIENNLDLNYFQEVKTTGTHYLSNLLGLLYLGLLFQFIDTGKRWLKFSVKSLITEMEYQVDSEGVDYESSIACYHCFALEHFLTAYLLFKINNLSFPLSFCKKLEKMFEFVFAYSRPDGSVPQIGDTGDGRVHIFSEFYSWPRDDHREMLMIGAELFDRPDFILGSPVKNDTVFWLFSRIKINKQRNHEKNERSLSVKSNSVGFFESGFFFMKSDLASVTISANPVGMKGKGNHKHNDIFSIDLFYNDTAFIVDPGSYVYTSDLEERYRFRSTAYHNVLQINRCEQNRIYIDRPWRVEEKANPKVIHWETCSEYDLFIGQHHGFMDLFENLIIQRKIYFDKIRHIWIIQDELLNDDEVSNSDLISVYFHLNNLPYSLDKSLISYLPPVSLNKGLFNFSKEKIIFQDGVKITSDRSIITIRSAIENHLKLEIRDGWISRSYGKREPAPVVVFHENYQGQKSFIFHIEASKKSEN